MICSISVTIRLCLALCTTICRTPSHRVDTTLPALSAHATVRRRRLPGDMVIWWWCNEPITDVVRRLNLSADGKRG